MTHQKTKLILGTIAALIGLSLSLAAVNYFMDTPSSQVFIDDATPLSWSAPQRHEDNSAFTDLSGYTIYCWNSANQKILEFEVDDPESSRFEVENFAPGTYQCAIKARSEHGGESALSNVVTRTISPR